MRVSNCPAAVSRPYIGREQESHLPKVVKPRKPNSPKLGRRLRLGGESEDLPKTSRTGMLAERTSSMCASWIGRVWLLSLHYIYMNKNFTSLAFALLVSASALAQTTTIRVQGAPRKVSTALAANIKKAAEATTSTGIDFSKIERWTGQGDCQAALAIKWADGQNEGKTLVWGYRWNSTETKTGEDLIRAVVKADPALYMMASNGDWGITIGGIGYDVDGDRYVTLTTMKDEIYPRNGVFNLPSSEFDTSASTKWTESDAWNNGYMTTGFWNYYVADKATDALQMSMVGATGRTLKDGCVDAYVFGYFNPEDGTNTYDGNLSYLPATVDYTQGVYMVNEDWTGHRNSTVNFLSKDGTFVYDHVQNVGVTACYGTFYGNRFYAISKQNNGLKTDDDFGRITVCDANSTRIIKQIKDIDGKDGRSFCGIDKHKAYVSTTGGIYTLNLDELSVGYAIKNADGGTANIGECGNMVRLGNYVYAVEYKKNLHVIDCSTDRIVASIEAKVFSITMSKDGSLWVSTDKGISRVDTAVNKLEAISLPEGIDVPANSSYAWCADGLCASMQNNVIYWTSASGYNTLRVFKYDIDNNEFAKVIDLTNDADKWKMYSTSNLRIDPVTDNLYVSLFKDYGVTDYAVRIYDNKGNKLNQYYLEQKNYWFPGMFVFPDTEDPVAGKMDAVAVDENKEKEIDLSNVCTDADNFQAAIVKTVQSVTDEAVATATVKNGKLVVKGIKAGSTSATIAFCSNGITTTADVNINVSAAVGISSTDASANRHEVARYTVDGRRINQPQKGLNIVKYSDGSVKKVVVE